MEQNGAAKLFQWQEAQINLITKDKSLEIHK